MLPFSPPAPAAAYTERQLKQLRAQCLVFLAFRNNMEPKKRYLEIALGEDPEQGSSGGDGRGANGNESHSETASSSSSSQAASSEVLPPPDVLPLSSLRLSSPRAGARKQPRRGLGKIK